MNELVIQVEKSLNKKSAVRVKSSALPHNLMSRDFGTAHSSGFKAPFTLSEGLHRTLHYEFIDKEKHGVVFESE